MDETLTMRMRLQRDYRFEAAHFLPFVPPGHPCARVHGHSYVISITIEGDVDPITGWVMDFAEIDAHVQPAIARLDHRLLNDVAGLANPTSEQLAAWMWKRCESLPGVVEVRVSETQRSSCTYTRK